MFEDQLPHPAQTRSLVLVPVHRWSFLNCALGFNELMIAANEDLLRGTGGSNICTKLSRTGWRDYLSHLAREGLRIPQEELGRDGWV